MTNRARCGLLAMIVVILILVGVTWRLGYFAPQSDAPDRVDIRFVSSSAAENASRGVIIITATLKNNGTVAGAGSAVGAVHIFEGNWSENSVYVELASEEQRTIQIEVLVDSAAFIAGYTWYAYLEGVHEL